MNIRILSANIAFGLREMDKPWRNFFAHLGIHGWRLIPLLTAGNTYNTFFDLTRRRYPERSEFIKEYSDVSPIVHVIEEEQPDVVVLNELVYRVHKHEIERWLREAGYEHFAWGKSAYHTSHYGHRDMTTATLVASRLPVVDEQFKPTVPQRAQPGGGGGTAGLRLKNAPVTIIGVHLCIYYGALWRKQMRKLARIVEEERVHGRKVVIAGDFNATLKDMTKVAEFRELGLHSADPQSQPTCPTAQILGFPRMRQIDHIAVPNDTEVHDFTVGDFGSDHKWIASSLSL